MPLPNPQRRPSTQLSNDQKSLILKTVSESKLTGAVSLRLYIQKYHGQTIPRNKLHLFLLENGVSRTDKKKQKQRKYCRYERKHSFSLVHLDWHESKVIPDKFVCVVEDDASRLIIAGGEFNNSKAGNNIRLMQETIFTAEQKYSAVIDQVNTDKGAQFYSNKYLNNGNKGQSDFEKFLAEQGITHIPSRRNHPQTNGKEERWFRTYEEKRGEFETFEEFIEWYNNRIHLGLSRTEGITPNESVISKLKPESLLGLFWRSS